MLTKSRVNEQAYLPIKEETRGAGAVARRAPGSGTCQLKSSLFHGLKFAIDEESYDSDLLYQVKRKIKEHSGDIISYKGVDSIAEYFVMNDGSS